MSLNNFRPIDHDRYRLYREHLMSEPAKFPLFAFAHFWEAREASCLRQTAAEKKRFEECETLLRPLAHAEFWRAMRDYRRRIQAKESLGLPAC